MVDYVSLASTALRLITANGRTVTFTVKTTTPADTNKPWRGTAASGDTTFDAVSVIVPFENDDVDGKLVRRGDSRLFVAANSVTGQDMESVDTVTDRDELWKVIKVNDISPGNTLVLYEIQLRR